MNKNELLCLSCRHARKSGGKVVACVSIGNPTLAFLYGGCRKYEPKNPDCCNKTCGKNQLKGL